MGAKLDAIGMLARFVPFDTTGARVNHDCIDFVRQSLAARGSESRITRDPTATGSARAACRRLLNQPGEWLAA